MSRRAGPGTSGSFWTRRAAWTFWTARPCHRKLSDLLDEADPIEGSYTLEVGSAGAERALKRPGDFAQFLGSPVLVKLYRAMDGQKEIPGVLTAYDPESGAVTVEAGGESRSFEKKDVALVRLRVEF